MPNPPRAVDRGEQSRRDRGNVTTDISPLIADRLVGICDWLAKRGIEPTGAPFFRYSAASAGRKTSSP